MVAPFAYLLNDEQFEVPRMEIQQSAAQLVANLSKHSQFDSEFQTPNLIKLSRLSIEASNQLVGKNMARKCVSKRKGRDRSFTSNHPFFLRTNSLAWFQGQD